MVQDEKNVLGSGTYELFYCNCLNSPFFCCLIFVKNCPCDKQ